MNPDYYLKEEHLYQKLMVLYKLMPTTEMIQLLKRDYKAMANMIFGAVPNFNDIISAIFKLEEKLNSNIIPITSSVKDLEIS